MSGLIGFGAAYLNGIAVGRAELRVERDVQTVWTRGLHADTTWTFTDAAHHFHAYDRTEDATDHYPTLTAKHRDMPCDGSCGGICGGEGYTITEYFCRICQVLVEPGLTHGDRQVSVPGPWSWSVLTVGAASPVPLGNLVSVRFETATAVQFGVAQVSHVSSEGVDVRTTLQGVSALGRAAVKNPVAVKP